MKVIEYYNATDIVIEFQDEYKTKVNTRWDHFNDGGIRNPYSKDVYGIGYFGTSNIKEIKKEYQSWHDIFRRCYDSKFHKNKPTYIGCKVCEEWNCFLNFYSWMKTQPNYKLLMSNNDCCVDKDILFKGNKIYSPETCCLVPKNVNTLFVKADGSRGEFPIGVSKYYNGSQLFQSRCRNPFKNKTVFLGLYNNTNDAFISYKKYKENMIKDTAKEEYKLGNITKQCFESMMKYKVEITD